MVKLKPQPLDKLSQLPFHKVLYKGHLFLCFKKIKKCSAPEYEVSEIDVANKQVKFYKVKLSKVEALSDEDASWYENRNETEKESAGQA